MNEWNDFKKELLSDKNVFEEYKKLEPKYKLISQLISARLKNKMTQAQLAEKIGTKQSAVARLEGGNFNPTILFLEKISQALNTKFILEIG